MLLCEQPVRAAQTAALCSVQRRVLPLQFVFVLVFFGVGSAQVLCVCVDPLAGAQRTAHFLLRLPSQTVLEDARVLLFRVERGRVVGEHRLQCTHRTAFAATGRVHRPFCALVQSVGFGHQLRNDGFPGLAALFGVVGELSLGLVVQTSGCLFRAFAETAEPRLLRQQIPPLETVRVRRTTGSVCMFLCRRRARVRLAGRVVIALFRFRGNLLLREGVHQPAEVRLDCRQVVPDNAQSFCVHAAAGRGLGLRPPRLQPRPSARSTTRPTGEPELGGLFVALRPARYSRSDPLPQHSRSQKERSHGSGQPPFFFGSEVEQEQQPRLLQRVRAENG